MIIQLFESVLHQITLMIFQWSFKSPQVSRTLLSFLADLNNAVVWTVSSYPFIFKSSSSCSNPLVTVPRAPIIISITVTFVFHCFFYMVDVLIPIFANIQSYSVVRRDSIVHNPASSLSFFFFFFVDYYKFWSSGRRLMIRLYLKIPEEFLHFVLLYKFSVWHIPFVCIVKIELLAPTRA